MSGESRMSISSRKRIAFYPCCADDIRSARQLLAPFADKIIFCDIRKELNRWIKGAEVEPSKDPLPEISVIVGDARDVDQLPEIDVLFYRRDSEGEGGSRVFVLGDVYMERLLPHFPRSGGLIITDGSNERQSWFRKMTRQSGFTRYGFYFAPIVEQSLKKEGLSIIGVTKADYLPSNSP